MGRPTLVQSEPNILAKVDKLAEPNFSKVGSTLVSIINRKSDAEGNRGNNKAARPQVPHHDKILSHYSQYRFIAPLSNRSHGPVILESQ